MNFCFDAIKFDFSGVVVTLYYTITFSKNFLCVNRTCLIVFKLFLNDCFFLQDLQQSSEEKQVLQKSLHKLKKERQEQESAMREQQDQLEAEQYFSVSL